MNTNNTPRTQAATNKLILVALKRYDITEANGYSIVSDDNKGVIVGGVILVDVATTLQLVKHYKNIS